jgi:hypothetical protein
LPQAINGGESLAQFKADVAAFGKYLKPTRPGGSTEQF